LNRKTFALVSAFFFFYFSIIGVWVIFLPKILHSLGYLPFQIGVIFSIPPLMRFLTPFLFLKHFKLTKTILYINLVMMLLCIPLLYLTIDKFVPFAIANIFFGFSFSFILPYIESYALVFLKKEKFGRSRLFGSIGFTLVALILARNFDTWMGLHFISVSVVMSAFFAYLISLEDGVNKSDDEDDKSRFDLLKHLPLWVSIFLMQVGFGAFYSFFTIYENEHGISLEMVSYLWSFGVLCEIVLFYFQEYIIRYDLFKLILFSIFVTILRWLILYLFPSSLFLAFVSQAFHAFSFALYHTATLSYLYRLYSDKKLAAQFYYGFGFGLGGFVGSIVAGWFYGEYLFLSSALITFFAFIFLILDRSPKKVI